MKKKNHNLIAFLLIILIAVASLNAYIMLRPIQEPAEENQDILTPRYIPVSPPSLEGYIPIEIDVTPGIIYLTHNCTGMTMVTTEYQTYSIENGMLGIIDPRPTSHDVMKDMLDNWNVTVTMARIDSAEAGTYYATLILEEGDRVLMLDTRPSDSIAMAIRYDAPIYISQELLDDEGVDVC